MPSHSSSGLATDVSDNDAEDSGAAYTFVRVDSTWEPLMTLKATNSEAGDGFGFSVWLEGDRLAVGATLEDSATTGVNGNQSDNSAVDSGAVYVFEYRSRGESRQPGWRCFTPCCTYT